MAKIKQSPVTSVRITFNRFDPEANRAYLTIATERDGQRDRTTLEAQPGQLIASDQSAGVAAILRGVRLVGVSQMGSRACAILRRDLTNAQVTIPTKATFNLDALPQKGRHVRDLVGNVGFDDNAEILTDPRNILGGA